MFFLLSRSGSPVESPIAYSMRLPQISTTGTNKGAARGKKGKTRPGGFNHHGY